ncbi:MAG: FAD-dependent oxidoreductase [Nanoarchaeota archaeon]
MDFSTLLISKRKLNDSLATFTLAKPATFNFTAGQFILISFDPNFKNAHPFSISSCPQDPGLEISVRKLGDFTQKLHATEINCPFWVKGPFGAFVLHEEKNVVMIAGGVGITPFLSMIRDECKRGLQRDLTLLLSVRELADVLEKETFDELQKNNSNLHIIYLPNQSPSPDWTGPFGIIDQNFLAKQFPSFTDKVFYLCGPPPMVAAIKQAFANLGLNPELIRVDSWEFAKKVVEENS